MRPIALMLCALALPLMACTGPAEEQDREPVAATQDYEGDWTGTLDVGAAQLRLVLEVRGEHVVLISVDQSGARLPAEVTQRDASGFAGTITAVGAALDLALTSPDTLSGEFSQGGATFPLTLQRSGTGSTAPAGDFIVRSGDVRLAGTLQLPEGDGPFPAILLLNGSGTQDRDAAIAGQRPFAALADSLAERGIASLRLDDRGIGGSDAVAPDSPHDLADDAAAALAALRGAAGIDAACTGMLGHSEGGMIAFLAAQEADPAFILTLAGMHMPMAQTLYDQSEAIILASGGTQAQADRNHVLQTAMFEVMRDDSVDDYPAALTDALVALGFPEGQARQQGAIWGQDYAIAALDLDPAPAMAAFEGPVHAFFGDLDLQVLAEPQSRALVAARPGLPTRSTLLGGVNHLFQTAETGLPQEYATAEHAMAPEALTAIGEAAEALITQACE